MKSCFFFLLLNAIILPLHAQENFYRSKQNPYYWGNRKPHAAYWQQDVHYRIKADINEKTDIISGHMQLTYWNNSPDTLYEVFFHLYENAFQPGSYYDDLHRNNKVKPLYGKYEKQGLGTVVLSFKHEDEELEQELDNTIMRVKLRKPILPGTSTRFELDFKTYFDSGSIRRRNKVFNSYGYKHYDGTHWYPIICVYDPKFKWTTDQHLGREFYANFGTFDVELTFAAHFIVEATGVLLNRDEVLPDTLRKKLDISNFKNKPLESKPSVIIPYDSTRRKTWKYHAENVHNFAFTADPTYRIGEAFTKDGVQCITLVQEPHAANWIPVAEYTVKVLELFSKDFGQYAYPKMVVADARDGMEYPMLTLCGGLYPGNKALIAHEVGHNWFYGMVGSNETYRAMLDEGFTQFLTVWALDNIPDDNEPASDQLNKRKKWKERFRLTLPARDTRAYLGYLVDAIRHDDMPLNTHSDMFQGALRQGGGYRHVYTKTATMLYNLQYVLGDTLFQNAMKYYFNKWKMAHPYPEDFRQSIIEYTQTDLNWFFDQWMETTKTIDYKVKKVSKDSKHKKTNLTRANSHTQPAAHQKLYRIVFKRKGEMQMPIDFTVVLKNGDSLNYYIPNSWFEKKGNATVLPRWIGWQKLKPTYTAAISVDDKIKNVIIDPSYRLADINMMNNARLPEIKWHWDAQVYHPPDWRRYHIYTRPELWWNAIDGFKAGWHFNGNYMQYQHQFALSFWVPTGLAHGNARQYGFFNEHFKPVKPADFRDAFNYRFTYETGLNKVIKGLSAFFISGYQEGLAFCRTGFTQKIRNSNISVYMKLMSRPRTNKDLYVLNGLWLTEKINNSLNVEWNHRYQYPKGSGKVYVNLRNTSIAAAYDYTYAEVEKINITRLWRFELRSRFYARYGWGNQIPLESALNITGANNEALMEFPLLRSRGFVPPQLVYDKGQSLVHFQQGGGLNLRAFADMFIANINPTENSTTYYTLALSGGAINLELDLDGLTTWQPKIIRDYLHLDVYLFFDAGITPSDPKKRNGNGLYTYANDGIFAGTNGKVFANGGVGFAVTLKKFGALEKIKPFTLRCDLPWWATYDLFSRSNTAMDYRFMFGLYRSF
jgi:aminopeptidase N